MYNIYFSQIIYLLVYQKFTSYIENVLLKSVFLKNLSFLNHSNSLKILSSSLSERNPLCTIVSLIRSKIFGDDLTSVSLLSSEFILLINSSDSICFALIFPLRLSNSLLTFTISSLWFSIVLSLNFILCSISLFFSKVNFNSFCKFVIVSLASFRLVSISSNFGFNRVNSISVFSLFSDILSKFFLADENFSLILTKLLSLPVSLFSVSFNFSLVLLKFSSIFTISLSNSLIFARKSNKTLPSIFWLFSGANSARSQLIPISAHLLSLILILFTSNLFIRFRSFFQEFLFIVMNLIK